MAYEKRLIEGNFPCQQVGAETRRERGASSSLPPINFLHVWWARRPLTASRAAVLGSVLPADVNTEEFIRELGIVKKQVCVGNQYWTLVGKNRLLIYRDEKGEYIPFSEKFDSALKKENLRRKKMREKLEKILEKYPEVSVNPVYKSWVADNVNIDYIPIFSPNDRFSVITTTANPAATNERLDFASSDMVKVALGSEIRLDDEDRYGYDRAYSNSCEQIDNGKITILDPTAGGGAIPFEAMRLGFNVIANDLNPVASGIEIATLKYPMEFGLSLIPDLEKYSEKLVTIVREKCADFFPNPVNSENDGFLYCRYVTCPSCGERAPLLNAFALQKKKDGWMVIPEKEGQPGNRKIRFVPVRLRNGA